MFDTIKGIYRWLYEAYYICDELYCWLQEYVIIYTIIHSMIITSCLVFIGIFYDTYENNIMMFIWIVVCIINNCFGMCKKIYLYKYDIIDHSINFIDYRFLFVLKYFIIIMNILIFVIGAKLFYYDSIDNIFCHDFGVVVTTYYLITYFIVILKPFFGYITAYMCCLLFINNLGEKYRDNNQKITVAVIQ